MPQLSLDWSYSKKSAKKIDDYELDRSSERAAHPSKLHMNKYKRRHVLALHWGHSEHEMKEARKTTKKVQRQRSMTQVLLPVHRAGEAFVGLKNLVKHKKSDGEAHHKEWSDLSNSGSTQETSHRYTGGETAMNKLSRSV